MFIVGSDWTDNSTKNLLINKKLISIHLNLKETRAIYKLRVDTENKVVEHCAIDNTMILKSTAKLKKKSMHIDNV